MMKGKTKRVLLCILLIIGAIPGTRLIQHKSPKEVVPSSTIVERSLFKKLPIPFVQAIPGSGLHSFTRPLPYIETLSISPDGKKLALWLEPFRWEGKFCIINKEGEEEFSKDFYDFSLEVLFSAHFTEASDPQHIFWTPDGSKLAFSARRVTFPQTEEEEKTFKKWLAVVCNYRDKDFEMLKGYSIVNVVNPWGSPSDKDILLKKEEGEKTFSLALLSHSSGETLWSFTPKNFQIRADEVIARDRERVYVFEQELKDRTKIWRIDFQSKEEQLLLDLQLAKGFRYYSIPSPNLKYVVLVAVPQGYPLKLSGPKTFFEVRELSTGSLVKKLSFKDYWLGFLRWSPDASLIAFLKFNRTEGFLSIWDIEKDKLYELPTGQWEVITVDFAPPSNQLYVLSRENAKECNIYIVDIPQ